MLLFDAGFSVKSKLGTCCLILLFVIDVIEFLKVCLVVNLETVAVHQVLLLLLLLLIITSSS
jgi:hypothetical protein